MKQNISYLPVLVFALGLCFTGRNDYDGGTTDNTIITTDGYGAPGVNATYPDISPAQTYGGNAMPHNITSN